MVCSVSALEFIPEISMPDSEGLVTVRFVVAYQPLTYIVGYVGPAAAVATEAIQDSINIPHVPSEGIFAVLEKVKVDDDERGKGLGRELVRRFLAEVVGHGAEAVYLYAEPSECGFDNVGWYERWDFHRLDPDRDEDDPVMIRVTSTARRPLQPQMPTNGRTDGALGV